MGYSKHLSRHSIKYDTVSLDILRHSTGIPGLDDLLHGGLLAERSYLVRGQPGAGKTTLGLQFLEAGQQNDETPMFINFGEEESTLRATAEALDIDVSGIEFVDLVPSSNEFVEDRTYDIFSSSEVEGKPLADDITEAIDATDPDRVVVDPVTQFRYLTPDEHQFHKQMRSFLRYLTEKGVTVLFTSQATQATPDDDLQFMSDGIIELGTRDSRRTIEITKFRSSDFRGGSHGLQITDDGIEVYPRITPGSHQRETVGESLSSGVPDLDELLGGGLERGTVTIVSGPSGAGKTTFGSLFVSAAAGRGERSDLYLFDEAEETFRGRNEAINIPVVEMEDKGSLGIHPIEALEYDAAHFAHRVREDIEENETDIVMIDSIQGYRRSIHDKEVVTALHALARYLTNHDVTVILVTETSQITGEFQITEWGGTYLADNVVFLRHLELGGEIRKAIGVLKKRMSDFERTLREYRITQYGVKIGEPLTGLRNVLSGTPEFITEQSERETALDIKTNTSGDE